MLCYYNNNLAVVVFQPRIPFNYGRQDCSSTPVTAAAHVFPHGHFDFEKLSDFTSTAFGMNDRETVAIMGAHTLGGASGASGFLGFWKEGI